MNENLSESPTDPMIAKTAASSFRLAGGVTPGAAFGCGAKGLTPAEG